MLIGEFAGGRRDAVIKFNLASKPPNIKRAELWFEITVVEAPLTSEFYEINSSWAEYTVTWNNVPPLGDHLLDIYINQTGVYNTTITSFVENETSDWSIRIISSAPNYVRMASKEAVMGELFPQIRFYYQAIQENLIGIDLSTFITIVIIGGIIGISVIILKQKAIRVTYSAN